jgi:hypothetical protein
MEWNLEESEPSKENFDGDQLFGDGFTIASGSQSTYRP